MICWEIVKNLSLTLKTCQIVKLCGGGTRYGIEVGKDARGISMNHGSESTLGRT